MTVLHRPGPISVITAAVLAVILLASPAPSRAAGIDDVLVGAHGGNQPQGRRIVIELRVGADEVVSVAARGFVRQGGRRLSLHRATATVAPGRRATLELRPRKARQERRIRRALRAGKTLEAKVRIRFRDVMGNVARRTRTIELT